MAHTDKAPFLIFFSQNTFLSVFSVVHNSGWVVVELYSLLGFQKEQFPQNATLHAACGKPSDGLQTYAWRMYAVNVSALPPPAGVTDAPRVHSPPPELQSNPNRLAQGLRSWLRGTLFQVCNLWEEND